MTACTVNGQVHEALEFLCRMSAECDLEPCVVSWSAIIGDLSQDGYDDEAVKML